MKFCIHCGKRMNELLHPFHNGGPVHRRCYVIIQKDASVSFKQTPVMIEDQKGVTRLRLVPGRVRAEN